jgi:hypothetical protein
MLLEIRPQLGVQVVPSTVLTAKEVGLVMLLNQLDLRQVVNRMVAQMVDLVELRMENRGVNQGKPPFDQRRHHRLLQFDRKNLFVSVVLNRSFKAKRGVREWI